MRSGGVEERRSREWSEEWKSEGVEDVEHVCV